MSNPVRIAQTGQGQSQWFVTNFNITPVEISISVVVDGTVNYTVQYTYDDLAANNNPEAWNLPALTSKATKLDATIKFPITGYRLVVNSVGGTATMTAIQAGIIN